MNLPDSLNRKAISQIFDQLEPVTWEKLFDRENGNGLAKLRCQGDFLGKAYYETEGLLLWLIRNGHYTPEQLQRKFGGPQPPSTVRTHVLAG